MRRWRRTPVPGAILSELGQLQCPQPYKVGVAETARSEDLRGACKRLLENPGCLPKYTGGGQPEDWVGRGDPALARLDMEDTALCKGAESPDRAVVPFSAQLWPHLQGVCSIPGPGLRCHCWGWQGRNTIHSWDGLRDPGQSAWVLCSVQSFLLSTTTECPQEARKCVLRWFDTVVPSSTSKRIPADLPAQKPNITTQSSGREKERETDSHEAFPYGGGKKDPSVSSSTKSCPRCQSQQQRSTRRETRDVL